MSAPTNVPVCENCKFWRQGGDDPNLGLCRRYAPRPALDEEEPIAWWPTTANEEWCGEHQLKRDIRQSANRSPKVPLRLSRRDTDW